MKRTLYFLLFAVVLFIAAYPKIDFGGEEEAKAAAPAAKRTLTVAAREMSHEPLDYTVNVTGTIIADESVDLNAEVSAKVREIHFREGQQVKSGQLLVSLDDEELQAERTKLSFTRQLNEANEQRRQRLLREEAISQEEYDVALTTLNTSEAELELVDARLAKHKIYAPFSGKIGLRQVSVGSYINTGNTIARIYKINPVKIDFSIPSRYLNDINVGDRLTFTVDAYEETFTGEIYALEPQIDPTSRSIKLRARCANPGGKLLPGQFAKISLILDQIQDAIMVPSISVVPELNRMKVFVYEDGKVQAREVTTGIRTEDEVQIVTGLQPGEVVITSGILQVRPGMEINVEL
ncbi:MAG: efflux RND transporter periplasmic adaptor subunit [Bacteroidota bacterium]